MKKSLSKPLGSVSWSRADALLDFLRNQIHLSRLEQKNYEREKKRKGHEQEDESPLSLALKIRARFSAFDVNQDNKLSLIEAADCMREMDKAITSLQIKDWILDTFSSTQDKIDFSQFVHAYFRIDPGDSLEFSHEEEKIRFKIIAELKINFDKLDKDKNGSLTYTEVRNAFIAMGKESTPEEIEKWIKARDPENKGIITFVDFALAYLRALDSEKSKSSLNSKWAHKFEAVMSLDDRHRIQTIETLKASFDQYDVNQDGELGFSEVCTALRQIKGSVAMEDVDAWIRSRDPLEKGSVSFVGFAESFVELEIKNLVAERVAQRIVQIDALHAKPDRSSIEENLICSYASHTLDEKGEMIAKRLTLGQTSLRRLVRRAREARIARNAKFGAAVLTKSGNVHTGASVESNSPTLSQCAERVALVKAMAEGESEIEALILGYCEEKDQTIATPCGSCRQLMAELGDFQVIIAVDSSETTTIGSDVDLQDTATTRVMPYESSWLDPQVVRWEKFCVSELMPHAFVNDTRTAIARPQDKTLRESLKEAIEFHRKAIEQRHLYRYGEDCDFNDSIRKIGVQPDEYNAIQWSVEDVCDWLATSQHLAMYVPSFSQNSVDGSVLLALDEEDVVELLGVKNRLHRRKLLGAIQRLRDKDTLAHAVRLGRMGAYTALLDREKLLLIARLKETFDRIDTDRSGFLGMSEIRLCFQKIGLEAGHAKVQKWIDDRDLNSDGKLSFSEFVHAYLDIFSTESVGPFPKSSQIRASQRFPRHKPKMTQPTESCTITNSIEDVRPESTQNARVAVEAWMDPGVMGIYLRQCLNALNVRQFAILHSRFNGGLSTSNTLPYTEAVSILQHLCLTQGPKPTVGKHITLRQFDFSDFLLLYWHFHTAHKWEIKDHAQIDESEIQVSTQSQLAHTSLVQVAKSQSNTDLSSDAIRVLQGSSKNSVDRNVDSILVVERKKPVATKVGTGTKILSGSQSTSAAYVRHKRTRFSDFRRTTEKAQTAHGDVNEMVDKLKKSIKSTQSTQVSPAKSGLVSVAQKEFGVSHTQAQTKQYDEGKRIAILAKAGKSANPSSRLSREI